jgi:DNA-nicking Smr family endonuclease
MTKKPRTLPDFPAPPAERTLSAEEEALWRQVVGDVDAMEDREMPAPDPSQPGVAPVPRRAKTLIQTKPPAALPVLDPDIAAGVDKRTATRLRRGQLQVEGRIDLHGQTQEEAYRALSSFLAGSQEAGRRCVLVITGKGLRPDGRVGVIRSSVPHWLNQPHNRQRVLAYTPAAPKDGGEGAMYVLLKRRR